MDITTFRKIRHAARHVTAVRWNGSSTPSPKFSVGLEVAVEALGLNVSTAVRSPEDLERLAATMRVRLGEPALRVFQLYVSLQILLGGVARGGVERLALFEMAQAISEAVTSMELDGVSAALEEVYDLLRDDPADGRLVERVEALIGAVDAALGLVPVLRHGAVDGLDMSYADAYRLAVLLGRLRAEDLLSRQPAPWPEELADAAAWLGLPIEPGGTLSAEDVNHVWLRVEATLGIQIGGLADQVFRVAKFHALCAGLEFPGVALRKGLGDLAVAIHAMGQVALAEAVYESGQSLVGVDLTDASSEAIDLPVLDRVERWLEEVLPQDHMDVTTLARITVCVERFAGYVVPVTAAVLERFVYQFPVEERWVAAGLLDAIEYRDRHQLSASVGFLLDGFGVQGSEAAVLCELDAVHIRAFQGSEIGLPRRRLHRALADASVQTLVIADDALLDAGALMDAFSHLDAAQWKRLRGRKLVFAFALATLHGESQLQAFIEDHQLMGRIVVGQSLQRLSAVGWEHLPDVLTEIELARPLFSPHNPHWRGRDWRVARARCVDIGTALCGPRDALGYRGFQGRLVFGHRVPPSTLSLLWKEGVWRGRPWRPLFSVPDR